MTLGELITELSRRTGYPREEARVVADELVKLIVETLESGEEVKIRNVGRLFWKYTKGRKGFDVTRGILRQYPPGWKLVFKPAHRFRGVRE